MGKAVMVLGKSGDGKSSSLRNIPDNIYSVVEVCGKPLPFRTKKKPYNTDDYTKISAYMAKTPADIIVIDDSQYLMANEYLRSATQKFTKDGSYDFYKQLGYKFWNLINEVSQLPDSKIVYFLHHVEDDGLGGVKEKTIGKMLDEKICIAGMFSIVLYAVKNDKGYLFATQNDGKNPAKTPIGMFKDQYIGNDLLIVDQAIRAYYEMPEATQIQQKGANA